MLTRSVAQLYLHRKTKSTLHVSLNLNKRHTGPNKLTNFQAVIDNIFTQMPGRHKCHPLLPLQQINTCVICRESCLALCCQVAHPASHQASLMSVLTSNFPRFLEDILRMSHLLCGLNFSAEVKALRLRYKALKFMQKVGLRMFWKTLHVTILCADFSHFASPHSLTCHQV